MDASLIYNTRSLLSFHGEGAGPLVDDELTILNGVLELSTKTAEAIMTPLKVNIRLLLLVLFLILTRP